MATVVKSKLVCKSLGNPKTVTMLPDGQNKFVLGTIIGIATGIVTRTMPNGDTFEGLGGSFEGIPSDPKLDTVKSSILYLPAGVFELIADPLSDEIDDQGEVTKPGAKSVTFGFEVATVKDSNAQGYAWSMQPLGDVQAQTDPLNDLRQRLNLAPAPKPAEIEAPKEAAPAAGDAAKAAVKNK